MANKKKSLAQELAELYNPAPATENDPDALELGDGVKLASDDEYEEARRAPSRHAPEKARLLRGDILLDDAAYRGRKTSRAAVFGDDSDEDESGVEDVDLELGDADGTDLEEEEEEDAERRASAGRAGPSGRRSASELAPAGAVDKRVIPGAAARAPAKKAKVGASADATNDGDEEEEEQDANGLDYHGGLELGSDSDSELDRSGEEDEDGKEGREEWDEKLEGNPDGRGARAAAITTRHRTAGAGGGSGGSGNDELNALEAEYDVLQEEDEKQMAALRQKSERDHVKGVAVRHQQILYERALEQRILLQKCLQASNGLPRPGAYALLVRTQPEIRTGFSQLAAAARETLDQLLQLQRTLMARNTAIVLPAAAAPEAAGAAKRGREDADDGDEGHKDHNHSQSSSECHCAGEEDYAEEGAEALWQWISSHHEALVPFRDASLDSWHRRTVLSSGSGALRNGGLRALNQSVSSQVHALMRDPAKFIKRTRLTLAACPRVLSEPPRPSVGLAAAAGPADLLGVRDNDLGDAPRAPSSSVAADVGEEERDAETYDDSEFYQQLLKEFLDKGLAEGAAVGAPKAAKKRKQVDRRASKGRKLRYHVQEKLVAFMAPVDFELPSFSSNLFSNLFGHAGK